MNRKPIWTAIIITALLLVGLSTRLAAEVLCAKKQLRVKNGRISFGSAVVSKAGISCPSTHTKIIDLGARPSVYGDGSAGDLTVSTSDAFQGFNREFRNITILQEAILTVPSGTIIRCSGNFTNLGELVGFFGPGGGRGNWSTNLSFSGPNHAPPVPGFSFILPSTGQFGSSGTALFGGEGGFAPLNVSFLSFFGGKLPLAHFPLGGTGGAATHAAQGGTGGASIQIRAGGTIVNAGTIRADGGNGSTGGGGGGGGGVILLAAKSSIINAGTIEAKGGSGGDSAADGAAGGGGGGGYVYFASPSIQLTGGTTTVTGGSAGGTSTSVSAGYRSAGAGGGGCAGDGGDGADLSSNVQSSVEAGQVGAVVSETIDPTNVL